MSVAVLEENNKCHEIADDRESSLHVLTWTALRCMKYEILNKDKGVKEFFDAFDEARKRDNGSFHGGISKKVLMVTNHMRSWINFEATPLNGLIEELNGVFAVRYENKPTKQQRDQLQEVLKGPHPPADEYLRNNDVVVIYNEQVGKLNKRG